MFPGFLSMCMSYKIFLVTGHFDTTKVFHAMFFINLSTSLSFLLQLVHLLVPVQTKHLSPKGYYQIVPENLQFYIKIELLIIPFW